MRRSTALGWGILLAAGALLVVTNTALRAEPASDWPSRIRTVCAQYAGLDLSGLAPLCADAGYQEVVYIQPSAAEPYWPTVYRPIQPEDLDR